MSELIIDKLTTRDGSNVGAIVVADIDELLLLNTNKEINTTAIVKDSNRGGVFNYDGAQSGVNNGGTIFNGWVRQYDGAVNVKWFGAVGDWDDTLKVGTDNLTAFQNAVANQGIIYIPEGDYYISSTLYITLSNTKLLLAPNATIRTYLSADATIGFSGGDSQITNVGIEGGKIHSYSTSAIDGNAIGLSNVDNWFVDNVTILNARQKGITAQGTIAGLVTGTGRISNCVIEQAGEAGIAIEGVTSGTIFIDNCDIQNVIGASTGSSFDGDGIVLYNDNFATGNFDACQISNCKIGVTSGNGLQAYHVKDVQISNLISSNATGHGCSLRYCGKIDLSNFSVRRCGKYGFTINNIEDSCSAVNISTKEVGYGTTDVYSAIKLQQNGTVQILLANINVADASNLLYSIENDTTGHCKVANSFITEGSVGYFPIVDSLIVLDTPEVMSKRLGTSQTGVSGQTVIAFDTLSSDATSVPYGYLESTTDGITVKKAGVYNINALCYFANATVGEAADIEIRLNNGAISSVNTSATIPSNNRVYAQVSHSVYLEADTTIKVRVNVWSGTYDITSYPTRTLLNVSKV